MQLVISGNVYRPFARREGDPPPPPPTPPSQRSMRPPIVIRGRNFHMVIAASVDDSTAAHQSVLRVAPRRYNRKYERTRSKRNPIQWVPPRAPQAFGSAAGSPLVPFRPAHRQPGRGITLQVLAPPVQPSLNVTVSRVRVVPPQLRAKRNAWPDVSTPSISTAINIHTRQLRQGRVQQRPHVIRVGIFFGPRPGVQNINQNLRRLQRPLQFTKHKARDRRRAAPQRLTVIWHTGLFIAPTGAIPFRTLLGVGL